MESRARTLPSLTKPEFTGESVLANPDFVSERDRYSPA